MNLGIGDWIVKKIGAYLTKDRPPLRSYLCDFDRIRYEVRPADVLLIEGRNHVSHVIKQITQSTWSHACLYIGRLHDIDDPELREHVRKHFDGSSNEQLVIEGMLGQGTIVTPLSHYKNDHIRISRPAGLARADAQKVIAFAINKLGGEYSLRHLLDLFRFLFPWGIMPKRWRSVIFEHNALKPTHDICSSMIAEAFACVKFPILPIVRTDSEHGLQLIQRHSKIFTPSDFDYSPYFNIIKYPFFALSETAPYRDLPWQDDVVAIDSKQGIEVIKKPTTSTPSMEVKEMYVEKTHEAIKSSEKDDSELSEPSENRANKHKAES